MSHFYDIGCKTCNVASRCVHANHGDDFVASLIPLLPAIAQLGGLDLDVHSPRCEWMAWSSLIEFAKAHTGHDIQPFSEDGFELRDR